MSKPSTGRKPSGYWMVRILMWLLVGIVAWIVVLALKVGDIAQFAMGVLLFAFLVLSITQPRWFKRFITFVSDARNL